ncbi:MAG: hypothetical protein WD766_03725 [Gemmatimonadota bacterium]
MNSTLVISLYAAVGIIVTAYAFYHGVVLRRRSAIFSFADHATLALTTAAIGGLWPLFVPGLVVLLARQLGRYVTGRRRLWGFHRPQGARAGS